MLRLMLRRFSSLIFFLLFATVAHAGLLDVKISPAQIFDVQWSISGTTFNARNFTRPFYSVNPNGTSCSWCQMTTAQVQAVADNNQYFGFFPSTTNTGTYGLAIYNADGSMAWVLHNTGSIRALSPDVIFYNGNNFWGTVISVTEGFNYGASKSWTDIINHPTQQQIDNYVPGATQPLAAGETASAPPPPPPTPVYSSSITSAQTTRRNNNLAETTGHNATVSIIGSDNTVSVQQIGGGHYASSTITGNFNSIDILQTTTVASRHYLETTIVGDLNTLILQQTDTVKNLFVNVNGTDTALSVNQTGLGNHYLDLALIGNDHVVSITQQGTGNHSATIELTNGGGAWNFSLTQTGSVDQVYSLPHGMSDGSTVSGICSTPAGCNLTVLQE